MVTRSRKSSREHAAFFQTGNSFGLSPQLKSPVVGASAGCQLTGLAPKPAFFKLSTMSFSAYFSGSTSSVTVLAEKLTVTFLTHGKAAKVLLTLAVQLVGQLIPLTEKTTRLALASGSLVAAPSPTDEPPSLPAQPASIAAARISPFVRYGMCTDTFR